MSVFDKIKDAINLREYISKFIQLKPHGSKSFGICPFHAEKTASFCVSGANLFYCFGCSVGGDLFDFHMMYHRVDKVQALKDLAHLANINLDKPVLDAFRSIKILHEFFRNNLLKNKRALDYLHIRGVDMPLIERFGLGLASGTNDFLQSNKLKTEGFNDYFWTMLDNRIIFPIYQSSYFSSSVISFAGRVFIDNDKRAKYINGPNNSMFNKSRCLYSNRFLQNEKPKDAVYLVEGYLDVIMLSKINLDAAAIMGVGFNKDHLNTLCLGYDNVIVAMDGDQAGIASSLRISDVMLQHLSSSKNFLFISLPKSEDPASCAWKNCCFNFPQEELYVYLFNNTVTPTNDPNKKVEALNRLYAFADKITDKTLKEEYRKTWRNMWWSFFNRRKERVPLVRMKKIEDDILQMLLFKYIALYPEIKNDIMEFFLKVDLSPNLKLQLEYLLQHDKLDNDFAKKVCNTGFVENIKTADEALAMWCKVFEKLQSATQLSFGPKDFVE